MKIILIAAVAVALAAAPAASAATYDLAVKGRITRIVALREGRYVSVPAGQINVGDDFALRATFDTSQAELTSTFDADPTVNIYYLPGATASAEIGDYQTTFDFKFSADASTQLWNDRQTDPTDSQSFSFFNYQLKPSEAYAFDVGGGRPSESVSFNAYDWTATARSDDLISQVAPLSAFASKSFTYVLFNPETQFFVLLDGDVESSSLSVTAVPEPTTWAMMLAGFGMMGAAMRYRRKNTAISFG